MIDDILDITQDSATLGKPAMHDFEEGKTTLPYIYLYEALDKEDKNRLASMHGRRLDEKETERIKESMQRYGILQRAKDEAATLIKEAIALMRREGEDGLEAIASKMVERSF